MANPNREIRKMLSKKSHSWWWDSHVSPKNSKWLAENLEEMDQSVKLMLKLIEEEGDSFAKKAEMYYQRRPELISHVEDFYRRYRSLAERYDYVTGELRRNIPSEIQSQGSGSDFSSESMTPSPDHQNSRRKSNHRAAGFDVFLGSGSSFELSHKWSDVSSSSSDSASDSDEATSKSYSRAMEVGHLHNRIFELEQELEFLKNKLQSTEEENSNALWKASKSSNCNELQGGVLELEQLLKATNEKLKVSDEEIAKLKNELNSSKSMMGVINRLESELESSRQEKGLLESDLGAAWKQISSLEAELGLSRKETKQLQSALELEKTQMSEHFACLEAVAADLEKKLEEMKAGMSDECKKCTVEKSALEAKILALSEQNATVETNLRELDDRVVRLEADKLEMQSEIEQRKSNCIEKSRCIKELEGLLDALWLKYDTLMVEKDAVGLKVLDLAAQVSSRDDRIRVMNEHLKSLHLKHARLIATSENAQKLASELQRRVQELEGEVERQRAAIADGAEAKREAIRQLCFSLDHYRGSYLQLRRQALDGHRRRSVMAL